MQNTTNYAWVVTLSALLLCSCGKQKTENVQNSQVAKEISKPRLTPPLYTNIEAYINNYAYGPSSGGHMCWSNAYPLQEVMTMTLGWDGKDYTFELEYKGSEPSRDHYRANITYGGNTIFNRPLAYEGTNMEIWHDNKVRIGLRPKDVK